MMNALEPTSFGEMLNKFSVISKYNNFDVDLTRCDVKNPDTESLQKTIEQVAKAGQHVFTMKFNLESASLVPIARKAGLQMHHANDREFFMTRCLQGHKEKECSFPPFKTLCAGVTMVVSV